MDGVERLGEVEEDNGLVIVARTAAARLCPAPSVPLQRENVVFAAAARPKASLLLTWRPYRANASLDETLHNLARDGQKGDGTV